MIVPKREYEKTHPKDMVNVKTEYVRAVIHSKGVNQSLLSLSMGYCPEYLSNSIHDGRMQRKILKALSSELDFPYKEALKDHKKDKKHK